MDRQIVYPGSIPLDTDLLSAQRNTMVALGYLAQATLGTTTVVDGLVCAPTAPASLTVTVGPGSITALSVVDSSAFGSLAADTTDPLVKMGVMTGATSFTLAAPTTSGQSINYLIQASLSETDADPVVLPYYNAANPAVPFSGPTNSGIAQTTQRLQRVQLQLKPSAPANAGLQVTPAVDSGWVGLYIVTVSYGQTQVDAAYIAVYPGAPFIAYKLNTLTPGFSRMATFAASGTFIVPNGVTLVKVRVCGGGGGGGSGGTNLGGGGGGAGGYGEGPVAVVPGEVIAVTVGVGGAGGTTNPAESGSLSTFGLSVGATGGSAGGSAASFAPGGTPGEAYGGSLNIMGGAMDRMAMQAPRCSLAMVAHPILGAVDVQRPLAACRSNRARRRVPGGVVVTGSSEMAAMAHPASSSWSISMVRILFFLLLIMPAFAHAPGNAQFLLHDRWPCRHRRYRVSKPGRVFQGRPVRDQPNAAGHLCRSCRQCDYHGERCGDGVSCRERDLRL